MMQAHYLASVSSAPKIARPWRPLGWIRRRGSVSQGQVSATPQIDVNQRNFLPRHGCTLTNTRVQPINAIIYGCSYNPWIELMPNAVHHMHTCTQEPLQQSDLLDDLLSYSSNTMKPKPLTKSELHSFAPRPMACHYDEKVSPSSQQAFP